MTGEEPKIRIETREELIYLLAEAAAIEHNLMCCYLYAAWSLKRGERDGLTAEQAAAVTRWRHAILSVAVEEMVHLALASNLVSAIGGAPHFSRPNFPIPPGYHPSGVIVELAGFSPAVLDHFIFLERPEGKELRDSSEFMHVADYHRTQPKGRLMPHAQDYLTVGHLYRGIRHGFEVLAHHMGEDVLFCGDPAGQIGRGDVSLPGLAAVTDLKSAEDAIETIIEQGEGAPGHSDNSHYNRFLAVKREYVDFLARDPAFAPAFPVAHNPVMNQPANSDHRVFIDAPEAARVLDLANAIYGHALRCLVQSYGRERGGTAKRQLVDSAIDLMMILSEIGPHLASLPASATLPGVNAGVTFSMLRDVARLPEGANERRIIAERFVDLAKHARTIFPANHELAGLAPKFDALAVRFGVENLRTINAPQTAPVAAAAPKAADVPPKSEEGSGPEIAEGKALTITFDGQRCIHARFCVLGAPAVFRANTPGQWIHPDAAPVETLVTIAHQCPSGAISYARNDGGENETAPPVNTAYVRENGPYAVHADLTVAGEHVGYRATLCRCGASKRKPFCDGSHNGIGFAASGEPETRASETLAARDGPLVVDPRKNGPLRVSGNLEIVSGTGRTVDRVTGAELCRCGASRNKPFCDRSHLKIGFEAPGS